MAKDKLEKHLLFIITELNQDWLRANNFSFSHIE